ncbi:Eukaryotic translation initiation factor 3 subunit B [Glycine soja]
MPKIRNGSDENDVQEDNLKFDIGKIYCQIGLTIREDGFWMPVSHVTDKTLGYCFIEYNTPQEAGLAKEKTRGYRLDRSHICYVLEWTPITPPETNPYKPVENLQYWMTDPKARDQFVIHAGSDTEVIFVLWSPLGTYLATVHRQGVKVWGGATAFNPIMRYAHPQLNFWSCIVKFIDFSPGEKYLVTYSSHEPSNTGDANRVVLNIFDVRTGKIMRNFNGSADDFATGGVTGGVSWPIFSWSPTDPILSLFVPDLCGENQPASVSLVQIPSKEELRQKNLFSVSDYKMHWQSNGEYLAVKVDRYTKTKKSTYTGFELFRIKERDMPIKVLELENKNDKTIAFA